MRSYLILSLIAVALLFGGSVMNHPSAQAQSATPAATASAPIVLTVTKLEDTNDGICDSGDCSLREAISNAAPSAIITFSQGLTGTVTLSDALVIMANITINGPGPKSSALTISGNNSNAVFVVKSGATLNMTYVSIVDGYYVSGGGIDNEGGTVNIVGSTFQGNHASIGGAIANVGGTINITSSTFEGNNAAGGGAILCSGGTVNIISSTFQGNEGFGGAISNVRGVVTITHTTLHGNSKGGAPTIYNNYFPKTATPTTGSSASVQPGSIIARNTIIDTSSGKVGCKGISITDGGNNLQFPGQDCGSSIPTGDPKLGPLTDNGGPTWTMALQPGSAAIAKVARNSCLEKDQRGNNRLSGATCDIGAFQH